MEGVGRLQKRTFEFEWQAWLPLVGIVLCALVFDAWSHGTFLTPRNLSNLSRQICVNLTLAVGMTLVIITGGIDLSVGSVLALSGMVAAISQVYFGWASFGILGAAGSFVLALLVGMVCGGVNGMAVSRFKITPFIVSLGMMVICRGLTLIFSGASAVAPLGEGLGTLSSGYFPVESSFVLFFVMVMYGAWRFIQALLWQKERSFHSTLWVVGGGTGLWIFCGYRGIPYMVFVAIIVAAIGMFALNHLRFGRFLYAIGGNLEAATLSGVPVRKTLQVTYIVMGLLAALAGVLDTARVNGAVPSAGELAELDAIAAVVIGGTSLMGGIGNLTGTLFGVIIMGILNNGMSLVGISEHYQKVFKGIVIILAVYLDRRGREQE